MRRRIRSAVTNRHMMLAVLACAAAVLALIALSVTLVYRAHLSDRFRTQTHEQCQSIEAVKSAIRLVFQDYLAELEKQQDRVSGPSYRAAHDYYTRQLNRFRPKECP